MIHQSHLDKAEPPIVDRRMIRGISERLDRAGDVVVAMDEDEAARAVDALVADGARAIAVCFLWSFLNGEARAPGARPHRARPSRDLRHHLVRAGAGAGRVRARGDHRGQRLCRAPGGRLSGAPGRASRRRGLPGAAPARPFDGRADDDGGCARTPAADARFRPGQRRPRRAVSSARLTARPTSSAPIWAAPPSTSR